MTGREVRNLVDGYQESGEHTINFEPGTESSGIFIYRLEFEGKRLSGKMLYLK